MRWVKSGFKGSFLGGILFLWLGCSSSPEKVSLPFEKPEKFSQKGKKALANHWWKELNDPQLNQRMKKVLKNNFSLASAWQRLKAARAKTSVKDAELFPDLNATAEAEQTFGDSREGGGLQLGGEASYELDLWGRIHSLAEAEKYRAKATLADYRTVAITLSAEMARLWYQRLEAKKQLELAKEQLQTNQDILGALQTRFKNGLIRGSDVLRQRRLVESTREQVIEARRELKLLSHRVSVLQGRPPKDEKIPNAGQIDLVSLPSLPKTGIPAKLIKKRPDVRQAWHRVQAANQEVEAAISRRYPRITLTGSTLTQGGDGATLLTNWLSSLTGSLILPLIDGGERAAQVTEAEAIEKQRINEYAQTVLTAFREVEDALVREKQQRKRMKSLKEQVKIAKETYSSLKSEYFNGVNDYTAVLTTLTELQQLRRDLLSSKRKLIEARIALYRALSGGFQTPREKDIQPSKDESKEAA